jgi:hypothetical protein
MKSYLRFKNKRDVNIVIFLFYIIIYFWLMIKYNEFVALTDSMDMYRLHSFIILLIALAPIWTFAFVLMLYCLTVRLLFKYIPKIE